MARTAGRHTRKSRMQNSRKAKEKLKNFSRGGLVRHGIKDKPITARRLEHDNFNFLSAYARSCKRSRSASQLSVIFQIDSILRGRNYMENPVRVVGKKNRRSFLKQSVVGVGAVGVGVSLLPTDLSAQNGPQHPTNPKNS